MNTMRQNKMAHQCTKATRNIQLHILTGIPVTQLHIDPFHNKVVRKLSILGFSLIKGQKRLFQSQGTGFHGAFWLIRLQKTGAKGKLEYLTTPFEWDACESIQYYPQHYKEVKRLLQQFTGNHLHGYLLARVMQRPDHAIDWINRNPEVK